MIYSSTLRVIYTFIAIYDLEAEVFDIVAAYLNADVFKSVIIYIRQLYRLDDSIGCICCLKKVLYGLYGSPKWWYDIIVPVFKEYGFEAFVSNIYCFISRDKSIFLYLYVDNIIMVISIKALIAQIKKKFAGVFKIKELDEFYRYLDYRIDCN